MFFLSLAACADLPAPSPNEPDCGPVYVLPCDRGISCESCYDRATGDTLWSCSDGWIGSDDDTGVDVEGEVSCRCFADSPDDECLGGPFGGVF